MRHIESNIQQACVTWFRLQFAEYSKLLFAVPNGGARSKIEAARLKAEGVTAGVTDMILLYPSGYYHSLCIEFKTHNRNSRQSEAQKEWQRAAEEAGNRYVIVRDFDEFRTAVYEYLYGKNRPIYLT